MSHGAHAISQMYRVANRAPVFVCVARKAFETSSLDALTAKFSKIMMQLLNEPCSKKRRRKEYMLVELS